MNGYIGLTDFEWYRFLRARPELDEVNFWRPGGQAFRYLPAGGPFFFQLKAPHFAIAGFGAFARYIKLPIWQVWDVFRDANGVPDQWELAARVSGQMAGTPQLLVPRLGQGSFRASVINAYGKACAVTTEHSLPVLEAAHIRPWSQDGDHTVSNGLLLRRDLHRLFDLGYATVRPDLTFAVSTELEDTYANGRVYYALAGRKIAEPADPQDRPDVAALEWHSDVVFRG